MRRGALVSILNPKVSLFFLAFLPQFIEPGRGSAAQQILVLGLVFFVIALAIDLPLAGCVRCDPRNPHLDNDLVA